MIAQPYKRRVHLKAFLRLPTITFFTVWCFCRVISAQLPLAVVTPTPAQFTTIDSIVAAIPADLTLRSGGGFSVVNVAKASEAIESQDLDKTAVLRIKVQEFEPHKDDGNAFRIMAADGQVNVRGTLVQYKIWAYFTADQTAALAKVRKGDTIMVSGVIKRADIKMYGAQPGLSVDLRQAQIQQH